MTDYQPHHNFSVNQMGENNTGAQPVGVSQAAQHAQGVREGIAAHPLPTQIPAPSRIGESTARNHSRINFNPAHTCAICNARCQNNYSLEKHAAKERHKAFLCTCTTKFVRLATLNRHIAAQAGPKHYCTYCDGNKGFAREDKLIDHLRDSHKFGKNAIAQFRSQARVQLQGDGHAPPAVAKTGAGQPLSTSAGHDAGSGANPMGQVAFSAGTSTGPFAGFDGSINGVHMFSAAETQPFAPVEDCAWTGVTEDFDFSGLDFSGVEFAGFDAGMDLFGKDNHV